LEGKQLKKALLVILALIVIGVIAAPYGSGLMMEKLLNKQVARINELYAGQPLAPQIEIIRYDRGYRSTEILWSITPPYRQTTNDTGPIVLLEKAKHGLMGVTSVTSLNQNSWYSDFVSQQLDGKDPLSIATEYNFFNGTTATFAVDQFELVDEVNDRLIINPGNIVIKADPNLENIQTRAYFEGISAPGTIEIRGISLQSEIKMISRFLMDGESSFSIEQVNLKNGTENSEINISSLEFASLIDYDEAKNKISLTTRYNIEQLMANDETFDDIHVSLSFNQLDSEALENIYNVYADVFSDSMANLAAKQDPADEIKQKMAMAGIRLMPEVEKLLKKDLRIEIADLHLSLQQGEIAGDISIGLKKDMTFAGFMALVQQPDQLVDIFTFASNITLPTGLVPNQDRLLVPMLPGMQTGLFEMEDGKLRHRAEIKGDKLLLNGNEFILSY
jgi:uncharacterized protein YdgA (DUF945 family)